MEVVDRVQQFEGALWGVLNANEEFRRWWAALKGPSVPSHTLAVQQVRRHLMYTLTLAVRPAEVAIYRTLTRVEKKLYAPKK